MSKKESAAVTSTRITVRGTVIVAAIGLISALVLGYWQFVREPSAANQAIETQYIGRVIDVNTQQIIPGAKITLDLEGVPPIIYTDSEGVYRFKVVINSNISGQVRVDAPGYQVYTRNITISPEIKNIEDIRLTSIAGPIPSETPRPAILDVPTETPSSIPLPSSTPDVGNQIVQLIDHYYMCINAANPDGDDSDYERCWNLLSDRPDELQSHLNKNDYISFWKKYKITYALYHCSYNNQKLVDAKYYLYDQNDLSKPIGNGIAYYLEYSFALDANGWRIKGANNTITNIGSYCESQPRVQKLTIP